MGPTRNLRARSRPIGPPLLYDKGGSRRQATAGGLGTTINDDHAVAGGEIILADICLQAEVPRNNEDVKLLSANEVHSEEEGMDESEGDGLEDSENEGSLDEGSLGNFEEEDEESLDKRQLQKYDEQDALQGLTMEEVDCNGNGHEHLANERGMEQHRDGAIPSPSQPQFALRSMLFSAAQNKTNSHGSNVRALAMEGIRRKKIMEERERRELYNCCPAQQDESNQEDFHESLASAAIAGKKKKTNTIHKVNKVAKKKNKRIKSSTMGSAEKEKAGRWHKKTRMMKFNFCSSRKVQTRQRGMRWPFIAVTHMERS